MVRRAAAAAFIACAFALSFASAGSATEHIYFKIHLHLNAYAGYGGCSTLTRPIETPSFDTHAAQCVGQGEIGIFDNRVHFLTHGSHCSWHWTGDSLLVQGADAWGGQWILQGTKNHDWSTFHISDGRVGDLKFVTDNVLFLLRGGPGQPLAVDLSAHRYFSGASLKWGYSLDLVGYVRLTT